MVFINWLLKGHLLLIFTKKLLSYIKGKINMIRAFPLLLIIMAIKSFAQRPDVNWPLGTVGPQFNLHFDTSGVQVVPVNRNASINGTTTSYSDSAGNMLIYTNGCRISNGTTDSIINGYLVDSMTGCANSRCPYLGSPVPNGALIFKCIAVPGKYIVFTEYCEFTGYPEKLYYSILDMNANFGNGALLLKNGLVCNDTLAASLAAVKHSNGRSWWLIEQKAHSNEFIKILINDSGNFSRSYQQTGPYFGQVGSGQARFSPDGTMYATSNDDVNIRLFDFDRCTGHLDFRETILIDDSLATGLIEFSPSGRFLYLVTRNTIFQFDLHSSNIQQSMRIVATYDGYVLISPTQFAWVSRAPDRRLYISSGGPHVMHVIDQPDSLGMVCNVLQHSLPTPSSVGGLSSFPNYDAPPMDINCDSILQAQIYDIENISGLRIYPNPVMSSKFHIDYDENIRGEIIISDLTGKVLQREKLQHEIECTLPSGIYLLYIQTNNGKSANKKIIVFSD